MTLTCIHGKFTTASRKAANVTVSGNSVYVTVDNFRKYANATNFYCYLNDRTDTKENTTTIQTVQKVNGSVKIVNYKVRVTANSGLNIRTGASTSYKRVGGYVKDTTVTITKESNGWGKTSKGWICLQYTSKVSTSTVSTTKKYTTGTYKVTASLLNVRSGPGTTYNIKLYKQLTSNARYQNKKFGNYYANGYLKNVICDITKIKGNWGLTPSRMDLS